MSIENKTKLPHPIPPSAEPGELAQPSEPGREWMPFKNGRNQVRHMLYAVAKQIPDVLTLLRLILAVVLFGSGAVDGQAAPARDIWLLVIAWTTDMMDGRISRSLKKEPRLVGFRLRWLDTWAGRYETVRGIVVRQKSSNTSWLGKHDVYVDMFVSLAVLGYLTVTGLIAWWMPLVYLVIWGVLFLRFGIPEIFAQLFQNPIYAVFVFLTLRSAPEVLPWLLLWAAIAALFFWRRALQLLQNLYRAARG